MQEEPAVMKMKPKARLDKFILDLFYISLVTFGIFLLAEVGTRIYLRINADPPQEIADVNSEAYSYYDWREQYFEDKKKPGGNFMYEPFSAWKHVDKKTKLINVRNGYRVGWEPEQAPGKKDFVIFMFGGSTTYCEESPDDLTVASILAKELNQASSKYRFLVKNYGIQGFVSSQEVHLLIKLLRAGERPDAVIFYDGLNDIQTKVGLGRDHYLDYGYQYKLFRKWSLKVRLQKIANKSKLVRILTNQPSLIHSLLPLSKDKNTLRQNAESMLLEYENTSRLAKALGEEYGFQTFNFWGPSMFNTGKVLTAEEQKRTLLPPDLYEADQLAHDIVAQTAAEKNFFERVDLIDISHAFDNVTETIFVDANHVTPIGNAALVDAMLEGIEGKLDAL